ncbi:MAG: sugar phosphate isomerase/epimerase [Chloroflexi bacterium]|nr:sugar phosphate isomerase/epimerase [Chloroflexota bacterium]
MADRVLLSAGLNNIEACIDLACQHDLGIEVMGFAYPHVLDGDWQATLSTYKRVLASVRGPLAMHGPFMDMAPGSPDRRINQVCVERYQHALQIAHDLGAEVIVFHANFIASIQNEAYRRSWHRTNVTFWSRMADYAERLGVTLAVENMWEFDPHIIGDVLAEVDHPYLRACVDVGHAHLFSKFPFEQWLDVMGRWLVHVHVNNNAGKLDVHGGLPYGVIDYYEVLDRIRALTCDPTFTLEMDKVEDMADSLPYFELAPQPTNNRR